jgi:hypothetical protein
MSEHNQNMYTIHEFSLVLKGLILLTVNNIAIYVEPTVRAYQKTVLTTNADWNLVFQR